ncbi:MAG: hypothetical protein J0J06_03540 [Sphingomonas sp.]|nr:hypothetical protein [Sphingomonas sp.]
MNDRQFMIMLGLVVTAGLLIGLLAFRATDGAAGVTTASAGTKLIGGDPNAPHPSAADVAVDAQPDAAPQISNAGSTNGEPTPSNEPMPEMQGPASSDPPGTAADPSTANAPPSPLPVTPPAGDPS